MERGAGSALRGSIPGARHPVVPTHHPVPPAAGWTVSATTGDADGSLRGSRSTALAEGEDPTVGGHQPVPAAPVRQAMPTTGGRADGPPWIRRTGRRRRRRPHRPRPPASSPRRRGVEAMPTTGGRAPCPHRAVEPGVAEGEDPTVRGHQPVAPAVRCRGHAHDGVERRPPIEPSNPASPKAKTPPSEATSQYPAWWAAAPTTGARNVACSMSPSNPAPP